jgi:DNA-binding YbaB/EbfC family protein
MRQLMAQAQQMQQQMQAAQDELASREYEGSAGGGAVKARVKGSGELLSVWFDSVVLDPEDPEMAGDLVVAAVNHALRTATDEAAGELGGLAGGTDLDGLPG